MPIFDYRCEVCGRVYRDYPQAPKKCVCCLRNQFQKLPAAPAIRFKGTGWTAPTPTKKED